VNEQNGQPLDKYEENDTFGEVAFLLGGCGNNLRVIANGRVELYVLEAEYLKRLFTAQPDLGGRFFKYLASLLEKRIRNHESRSF
jgi:CRP-like cAMP-binding protein